MGSGRPPGRPFQRVTAEQELGRYLRVSCGAEMNQHSEITAGRDLTTFRRSHAVRHPDCDYAGEIDVHLTLCAATGRPFERLDLAQFVCGTVEKTSTLLAFRLYGYCLMPDHLHVLLSPAESRVPVGTWLREFKSFTTRRQQLQSGEAELWQRSAHDHVCRTEETAEKVLAYIVNNPVRAGLVERWQDWAWTKVFIAV